MKSFVLCVSFTVFLYGTFSSACIKTLMENEFMKGQSAAFFHSITRYSLEGLANEPVRDI